MGPTKLLVAALAALLTMAPTALAEEVTGDVSPAVATPAADAEVAPPASPADAATGVADTAPPAEAAPAVADAIGAPTVVGGGETPPPAAALPADDTAAAAHAAESADPGLETTAAVPAEDASATAQPTAPVLGAFGYDSEGRRGRIHVVVRGDTLWDISRAYLGTPWVWPSIWRDNDEIENPHLIHPGEHIWITPSEMRRLTPEEAALMLSNRPPAAPSEEAPTLDEMPAPTPEEVVTEPTERGSIRVSSLETVGLVTPEQLEAAASIVGRVPERVLMSQEDDLFIGLGEGAVRPGDQFTIFRTHEKVFDPDTRRLLGYHVEFLGYVEVKETYPETSLATIAMSTGEIEKGDLLMPREPLPLDIPLQPSPQGVDGKISFFPSKRVLMGYNDFVYLNRGSLDGLEVGSPLEVFRPGATARDASRDERVEIPETPIADLVVVRVEDQASVALVTSSRTELALGDRFRGR